MIISKMTRKFALQLPAVNFTAIYNTPSLGHYSVNTSANQNKLITKLEKNSVYLIERFCYSANLAEHLYLSAMSPFDMPRIQLSMKQSQHLLKFPMVMANYHQNSEVNLYCYTNNSDDELLCSMNGNFAQMPDMVGMAQLNITFSMTIYQADSNEFMKLFRGEDVIDKL